MGRRRMHAAFMLYKTLGYPELRYIKEVDKIGDITLKSSINDGNPIYDYYAKFGMALPFYPNHGYATCFMTGDGETKYMRIFAKGYTLDKQGALATITLQYQLY